MKRLLALVFVFMLLLPLAVSCGSENETESTSEITFEESSVEVMDTGYITVTPQKNNKPLINPYKGWIAYDLNGSFDHQSYVVWDLATVGYCRYAWSDIEKSDGEYDWDVIENSIKSMPKGKQFAFGIMACNPSSSVDYCTPQFICDREDVNVMEMDVNLNGTGRHITLHVVDYRDPGEGYYIKTAQLANALAERYGNDPRIAYIDIRSFGSWGENSYSQLEIAKDNEINTEVMLKCWQPYIDAFKNCKTKLVTAWGFGCLGCSVYSDEEAFIYAADQGVGVRRDGYGEVPPCAGHELLWSLNKAITVLEMPGGYIAQRNSIDAEWLKRTLDENRACYVPIGAYTDSMDMINDMNDAMLEVTNSIGYHFVLEDATFTENLGVGGEGKIHMRWTNDGNAKLFDKATFKLALLDEKNRVVAECILDDVDPTEWICKRDMYSENETNHEESNFSFDVPEGTYKLAFGIFSGLTDTPDIKVGNEGITKKGWYVIYDGFAENASETSLVKTGDAVYIFDAGKTVDKSNLVINYGTYRPENAIITVSQNGVDFDDSESGRFFKIELKGIAKNYIEKKTNLFSVTPIGIDDEITVENGNIKAEASNEKELTYIIIRPLEIAGSGKYKLTFKAKADSDSDVNMGFYFTLRGSGDHGPNRGWWETTVDSTLKADIIADGEWHEYELEHTLDHHGCIEIAKAYVSFRAQTEYSIEIEGLLMTKVGEENGELGYRAYSPNEVVIIESITINQ